jgi:PAS domain S-box-containing protein
MELNKQQSSKSNEGFIKRKSRLPQPDPVDREIKIPSKMVLLSVTDTRGVIEYCNEDFVEISGYEEYELVGAGHNIVRHPDMPRVIFKILWDRIQKKQNILAIVKNMGKTGRYYWVYTDFVIKEDDKGNIIGYKAYRKPAPSKAIETIIPIYKKLKAIEEANDMEAAEKYLMGYLDVLGTNYDNFVENLIIENVNEQGEKYSTDEKKRIETENKEIKKISKKDRKSFFQRIFGY